MKIYLKQNVLEAALERINRLFDEFEVVLVNFSGGKDSTVVLNLALRVAEERGRLPLPVMFIDQEAEWDSVIDYVRQVMYDPRVEPYWLQVPFRISNATSAEQDWLHCWEEGAEWLRPKDPIAIHENIYGTDRFYGLFDAFLVTTYGDQRVAQLAGLRAEESPGRLYGLTVAPTYKDITWGYLGASMITGLDQYTFYPIYDWSYTDVWKAIHEHQWPYCGIYDLMYQYGIPVQAMRVSNVHHEQAAKTLIYLQELEPDLWNRLLARLQGVNSMNKLSESYRVPKELPWMFASWEEYRDYLVEHLIEEPEKRAIFRKLFDGMLDRFRPEVHGRILQTQVESVLNNDYHGVKLETMEAALSRYRIPAAERARRG